MKKLLISLFAAVFTLAFSIHAQEDLYTLTLNPDESSPTGYYIPIHIQECFSEMDKMFSHFLKEQIRDEKEKNLNGHRYYHTKERLIEIWDLRGNSRLREYFRKKLKISKTKDMMNFVMLNYWRYLNGLPVKTK